MTHNASSPFQSSSEHLFTPSREGTGVHNAGAIAGTEVLALPGILYEPFAWRRAGKHKTLKHKDNFAGQGLRCSVVVCSLLPDSALLGPMSTGAGF